MKSAKIYMYDHYAGRLTEDQNGFQFVYDSDYLEMEGAEPISLTMPLREEPYEDKVLFPFFDGLVPEGWLLNIAERSWKINQRDRMSLLLACCKDCALSVWYLKNKKICIMEKCLYCYKPLKDGQTDFHPTCARKMFGVRKVPTLPYKRSEIAELAKQVIRAQTTLTGVQAKLSLDINPGGKNEPSRFTIVGLWGRYILKPQTDAYRALPELEDLTMHMAEAAKIAVVPHSLIRFADGELCYITRRIDRETDGTKIAMEDMCQLTERLTEYKYKGSYEQIAKHIKKYSAVPQLDLVNFWEVVVFSWITGNSDMHLKNFSLIKSPMGYSLTPAYDLLSTTIVMPEDKEEMALTLNGKKANIKRNDFEKSILASGVNEKVLDNIAKKFRKALMKWLDLIEKSFLPNDYQRQYKRLILKRILMLR